SRCSGHPAPRRRANRRAPLLSSRRTPPRSGSQPRATAGVSASQPAARWDRTPRGAPLRRRTPGSLAPVLFHPAELLQDDAGVQLLEERLRLAKLLPGLELRRRPRPCETAVVAGEDLVRRRVLLADGEIGRASCRERGWIVERG